MLQVLLDSREIAMWSGMGDAGVEVAYVMFRQDGLCGAVEYSLVSGDSQGLVKDVIA